MKNHYVILFLLISAVNSYSQSSNRLIVNYGITSQILIGDHLDGAGGQDGKGGNVFGVRYIRTTTGKISLETGLEYSRYQFSISPAFHPGIDMTARKENVELISVPLFANYSFAKYLFVNGGLIADFQLNKKTTDAVDRQSGVGLGIGFGGKYDFRAITLSINPYLQQHSIIPIEKSRNQERLLEAGIRFGVGYRF